MYADDMQIYITFAATIDSIEQIRYLMCCNFLKLNDEKTKVPCLCMTLQGPSTLWPCNFDETSIPTPGTFMSSWTQKLLVINISLIQHNPSITKLKD